MQLAEEQKEDVSLKEIRKWAEKGKRDVLGGWVDNTYLGNPNRADL